MKYGYVLGALAGAAACVPPTPAPPARVWLLGVEPRAEIGPTDPVTVLLSRAAPELARPGAVEVTAADGEQVPVEVGPGPDPARIQASPAGTWPEGQVLTLGPSPALLDATGQPVAAAGALVFTTRAATASAPVQLRWPQPGGALPINQRTVFLLGTVPPTLTGVALEADGDSVWAPIEARLPLEVTRLRLPERRVRGCEQLCPERVYRLQVPGARIREGVFGQVRSATAADHDPPVVGSGRAYARELHVVAEVSAAEPVLWHGEVSLEREEPVPLIGPDLPAREAVLVSSAALQPESSVVLQVWAEDGAGHLSAPLELSARTGPRMEIFISEVVPKPLHDWGDSEPAGRPFDARPGSGTVSDADEWLELVNLSSGPIDLRSAGLTLRVLDSSPSETPVESAPALYFGDGGTRERWGPGEALVVRARGSMAQRGFVLELSAGPRLLDRVVVGEAAEAHAPSADPPDLEHEALARDASGRFFWCVPGPGDPASASACVR